MIVFFDEFSVTNRPSLFYGWAKKNTRYKVPSDEKKRERKNGLLAVDTTTGKEYIRIKEKSRTEDIVDYFYGLAIDACNEGYKTLTVFLDNNPTHKDKMRYNLWLMMRSNKKLDGFKINFYYTPPYSPDFNLAEYLIHQLRCKLLHNSIKMSLVEIEEKISSFFSENQLQSSEKINNTINHILKLGGIDVR